MVKKGILLIVAWTIAVVAVLSFIPKHILQYFIVYFISFVCFWAVGCFVISKTKFGNALIKRVRGWIFSMSTHQKQGKYLTVADNVHFHNPKYMVIGNNVSIDNGAEFFPLGNGYKSAIKIGNNVHIGSYNRIASMNEVLIEDDVLFAAFVHITDHSHEFKNIQLPVREQGVFTKGVVKIEKGAWLGFRCNILSGVTVGEHAVVAAGAVVTRDVPPYSVVAGCPARVIKKYDFDKQEWVKV